MGKQNDVILDIRIHKINNPVHCHGYIVSVIVAWKLAPIRTSPKNLHKVHRILLERELRFVKIKL